MHSMGRWSSFLEGCTRPSAVSVVLALGCVAAAFATAITVIDERFIATPTARELLTLGHADDDLEVTSQVLGLAGRDPGRPLVVMVGASETREMIDLDRFRATVSPDGVDGVDTEILAQPRQGLAEIHRLAERIPDGTEGVFVLSLGIGRFTSAEGEADGEPNFPRLGFGGGRGDPEPSGTERRALLGRGSFLLDNLGFYLPRLLRLPRNVVLGAPRHSIHRYDRRPPMPAAEWDLKARQMQSRLEGFDAGFAANAERLAAIVGRLRQRTRMSVVATILPVNPRFADETIGADRYRSMVDRVIGLVEAEGLPVIDLEGVGLSTSDYWDWIHLRSPETRARITDLLATTVRRMIESPGGST